MRYLVLLVSLLFFVNASFGQEIKYTDLAKTTSKKGQFTSYVSKDGRIYKLGDRVKIGVPTNNKTFSFIYQGDGWVVPFTPLEAVLSGTETEIKKIYLYGSKRAGFHVYFRTKGITGMANYSVQVENALSSGELKGNGLSSDEALAELKKTKDKLDLGLITQEEYNKKKAELSKFIK